MTDDKATRAGELSDSDLEQAVGGTPQAGKKTLATIALDPVATMSGPESEKALDDWTKASLDKGHVRKNCELIAADF